MDFIGTASINDTEMATCSWRVDQNKLDHFVNSKERLPVLCHETQHNDSYHNGLYWDSKHKGHRNRYLTVHGGDQNKIGCFINSKRRCLFDAITFSKMTLIIMELIETVSITTLYISIECHYAWCRYYLFCVAECHGTIDLLMVGTK
jgi:hypothetical protein